MARGSTGPSPLPARGSGCREAARAAGVDAGGKKRRSKPPPITAGKWELCTDWTPCAWGEIPEHIKGKKWMRSELEEAAARQRARSKAGLPLCDGPDMVADSHEASRGPGLRKQLAALAAGRGFSAPGSARGADGFVNYLQRARCSPAVTFAPGTPPTGGGTALGARGVWASHVGSSPARRGLQEPPIFRFDGNDVPSRATLVVTVRTDAAAGLVVRAAQFGRNGRLRDGRHQRADEEYQEGAKVAAGPDGGLDAKGSARYVVEGEDGQAEQAQVLR